MTPRLRDNGAIAWMARNAVAANLLMLLLIFGGIFMLFKIEQEYLPEIEPDLATITVALPGATPEEVEQSIVLAIEEELRSVQGIATIAATASEGSAQITAEVGTDRSRELVYNDIQQALDRVTSLPDDAEDPVATLQPRRRSVIEIHIFGDTTERSLRMAAEQVRTKLLQQDEISQVDLVNVRERQIHIEISQTALLAHGLTLSDVAATIRRTALDRAGGTLETVGGDLLLRMADRRDEAFDFGNIPLIADVRGPLVRLRDIAVVRDGFDDSNKRASFDGKSAIEINVFRVGEETPISVADTTRRVLPEAMAALPDGIDAVILNDRSKYYRDRMELLTRNGAIGLCLVLLILSLFLELRLAFWVALGIPTAFMGTLLLLPWTGVSINLVSMFAFILALGIVVDDAIVAGENIHEYRQRGMAFLEAAIQGARDIAVPLSFSIMTNIAAFIPLALVPGWMGKFWIVIPIIVALAFLMSWIEALFILPAHLAGEGKGALSRISSAVFGPLYRGIIAPTQQFFSSGLAWFIANVYGPALRVAMNWRYTTVALMILILAVTVAWPLSGRMGWGLFPPVPRDYSKAVVTMPVGTPLATTIAAQRHVVDAANAVIAENGGDELGIGVYAEIDGTKVDLRAYLQDPDIRPIGTREFTSLWREAVGKVPGARSIRFESSWGGPGGSSLEIRLSHSDTAVLEQAAARLATLLNDFDHVRDPDDGFSPGKIELAYSLTEEGRSLGLTAEDVAAQVRAAFFGVEALSQQDGRNEVTVRVRAPRSERRSEADIEGLLLRTPDGGVVPLYEVANVIRGRADAAIVREDAQRVVTVSANVEPRDKTNQILAAATEDLLPQLQADYPGLGYSLQGRQAAQRDTMLSFIPSVALTLVIIYGLLAIPFKSYAQPAIIMMSIPFGFVGAIVGHLIMGMGLSIISIFGIIALSGVVINSGIVMIDYANKARAAGASAYDAVWRAGMRRFRPILLTTMTTFCGLAPMIFETSRQAQFLVPMAISLGYGIVFATVIVLFLIPSLYMIFDDIRWLANPPRAKDPDIDPKPKLPPVAAE